MEQEAATNNGGRNDNWHSSNVWADHAAFEGNPVRQLLVPESDFGVISGNDGGLTVSNPYGSWPAFVPGHRMTPEGLAVQLPLGASRGSTFSRASWIGPKSQLGVDAVLASYKDALGYGEEGPEAPGLRLPQIGAVHAVRGYWTTGNPTPATVVMPTGTGKTETMLALLVATRPRRLLVLVPSDALREQVAAKFERLGVLQQARIVSESALRPTVGRVLHGFTSVTTAQSFADACNVIVATPNALDACSPEALEVLLASCSHLFIDEAHHVPAPSWSKIRNAFGDRPVVQFTATPFREDGKHLAGRIIYSYPLRKAQQEGYFSAIDYTSVFDFDDIDTSVADLAIARLRADLEAGQDHILMARVSSIERAKQILPIYQNFASDLNPVIVNSQMGKGAQKAAIASLRDRTSRIIVCVNMLGEGFDLPSLKIAAIHDPKKSLGVTLQFVGRFARTASATPVGGASVFVARRDIVEDKQLRRLYAENADWNHLLHDLSQTAVDSQQSISDFEAGFTSMPEEVNLRNLLPKMSTVVYQTPSQEWTPLALVDFFGEENLLTIPIGLNLEAGVAWCVVEHRQDVRWGDLQTVEQVIYELFVLYFDQDHKLLYINSSENSGVFQELTECVVGEGAVRFTGSTVYRVMSDIQRLTPTNVGVLDIHSQFRRFSMHVGTDVTLGFTTSEAQTKTQTNISGGGYRDGGRVNISASIKGRIWSHAAASSLKNWCDWCDEIGTRLLDDTISIEDIIGNFLVPLELVNRPPAVLLGLEWPPDVYLAVNDRLQLTYGSHSVALADCDLVPVGDANEGPFKFSVVSETWKVDYEADYVEGRLTYRCSANTDVMLVANRAAPIPLSTWLNDTGLTLLLERDQLIDHHGLLYQPNQHRNPYSLDGLKVLDWTGVNLRTESQGPERKADSIQARALTQLLADGEWDVVLDDDGKGEVADIVAMRIDADGLLVRLIHCKYSHEDIPGARLVDLYEVCGQANKCVTWRKSDMPAFFKYLARRVRLKQQRTGVSPFIVGDGRAFFRLQEQAIVLKRRLEVVIAQPGLSKEQVSAGQLDLLASSESYLRNTVNASLEVWCSA
jgi:superfamily II DNA or RNA helicase